VRRAPRRGHIPEGRKAFRHARPERRGGQRCHGRAGNGVRCHHHAFFKELQAEAPASRKCLERVPERLFEWQPHEKSTPLGYLSLIVAEIPKWIQVAIEASGIDFAKFEHFHPKTTAELVRHFDGNLEGVKKVLESATDEELSELFRLKLNGQTLVSVPKKDTIGSNINHLVHHRGQLTVYMR
jgi:uncharacterized damage-inducible protein DinB